MDGRGGIHHESRAISSPSLRQPRRTVEVVERVQVGIHGRVAPEAIPYRPWAPDVIRLGDQRIVLAFAMCLANRMDGRKVDDVEAHGGNRGEVLHGRSESAVLALRPPSSGERIRTTLRDRARFRSTVAPACDGWRTAAVGSAGS